MFYCPKLAGVSCRKRKDLRLPQQYNYFFGGETALRVGIVVSQTLLKEEEFLLAGMLWANRLSNGARTVIYFVAPDFSPFLLHALSKIGGLINAKAVYWRERLSPSLYLIPEAPSGAQKRISVGERRPNWLKWRQELNPVAQHQLFVVKSFFVQACRSRGTMRIKTSKHFLYVGKYRDC